MRQYIDTTITYKGKKLTDRQFEILELIGSGYSNQQISAALFLTPKTIESHLANIRKIVSEPDDRITDRRLTLLAREMVEGYSKFLNLRNKTDEFETNETFVEVKKAA